jgi:SulP family sulfate permease
MDASGLNALEDLHARLKRKKKHLVLCGPHTQPLFMMVKAGFLEKLGQDNACETIELALNRARELMQASHRH